MAFCRLLLPILIISVVNCVEISHVPAFLWGSLPESPMSASPLTTINAKQFRNIIRYEEQSEPAFIVVFAEETLSVEDLSLKNDYGETAYPFLRQNIDKSLYLPSVDSPLNVLKKLAKSTEVSHEKLTKEGLVPQVGEGVRFLFITLEDAQEYESRFDLLNRHNDFMEKTFKDLQEKYGNVIAVYTASYPSWVVPDHSRVRRQAEPAQPMYTVDGLLMYAVNIVLTDGTNPTTLSSLTSSNTEVNGTKQFTTLNFGDNKVVLNFKSQGGYWYLNTITVTQSGVTEDLLPTGEAEVYAIHSFSYRCAQKVVYKSVNQTKSLTLSFEDLHLQPLFQNGTSNAAFGDAFYCVGFFTAPIWAGLFVTLIMLLITFFGVLMLMDVKAMDRFDDPKGKTININPGAE